MVTPKKAKKSASLFTKEEATELYEQLRELGLLPAWASAESFVKNRLCLGHTPIQLYVSDYEPHAATTRISVQFTALFERGTSHTELRQILDKTFTEVFHAGLKKGREDTLDAISTALGLPTAHDRQREKEEMSDLEKRIEKLENQ